jgi:hypothetical protein
MNTESTNNINTIHKEGGNENLDDLDISNKKIVESEF